MKSPDMRRKPRPFHPESGYALLFVYMMAAVVAIMLYMQLPRVAFEAQRDKEQLLIDRGHAYTRAIQLYFRKFHQYPPSLDALDNTQNIRFIRHRYKDPMTGKDEWRLIHVGPGGIFTDSVLNKGKSVQPAAPAEKQNFVNELSLVNATNVPNQNQPVNLATRRRASDIPGAPGDPNNPGQGVPVDPNNPNAQNNFTGMQGAVQQNPNSAVNPANPNGAPAQPGQMIQGANGTTTMLPDGRVVPVVNGVPGGVTQMPPGQIAGQTPGQTDPNASNPYAQTYPFAQSGMQGQPGTNPAGYPTGVAAQPNPYAQSAMPGQPGAPPAAAASLINQLLTSPRQGGLQGAFPGQTPGMPGVPNSPFGAQPGAQQTGAAQSGMTPITGSMPTGNAGTPITGTTGQTLAGGIAGVASKADAEGIKVYNDRTNYKEWEFIYDLSKDTSMGAVQQGQRPVNGQQANGVNGATSNASPFGSSALGTSTPAPSSQQSSFGSQTPAPAPTAPAPTPSQ